jgi:hypothetical protein
MRAVLSYENAFGGFFPYVFFPGRRSRLAIQQEKIR